MKIHGSCAKRGRRVRKTKKISIISKCFRNVRGFYLSLQLKYRSSLNDSRLGSIAPFPAGFGMSLGECSRSFQGHEGLCERPQEIHIWCVRHGCRNVSAQKWGRSVSSETRELRHNFMDKMCHEAQFHGQNIYWWDCKSWDFRTSLWDPFCAEHWLLSLKTQIICSQALTFPLKFKIFQQNSAS